MSECFVWEPATTSMQVWEPANALSIILATPWYSCTVCTLLVPYSYSYVEYRYGMDPYNRYKGEYCTLHEYLPTSSGRNNSYFQG